MLPLKGLSDIETPLILAPMEGITDHVYRKICLHAGADAGISEFIAAEALRRGVEKSLRKMDAAEGEALRWVQLFGHSPNSMAEAAKVCEEQGVSAIDLNFGCPVKKIVSKGAGAALLKDLKLMQDIASTVVKAVSIPVTAKTRLGWDMQSIVVEEAAQRLQDAGIQMLTVHARTRSQQYGGEANWDAIASLKAQPWLKIPLTGNGDLDGSDKALRLLKFSQADALMIGRGAIGNPWLFRQIKDAILGLPIQFPTMVEKTQLCRLHFEETLRLKGEKRGVLEMRKFFSLYFKGVSDFKPYKLQLLNETKVARIFEILQEIETI